MAADMLHSFDKRRFELHFDRDAQLFILYESHTEERVYVEPPGDWELHFDDDTGTGYLDDGQGLSKWCDDILEATVTRVLAGALCSNVRFQD